MLVYVGSSNRPAKPTNGALDKVLSVLAIMSMIVMVTGLFALTIYYSS